MKINIGFEFETQMISMALWKTKDSIHYIYQPYEHYKKNLFSNEHKRIELYPDELKTTTVFYNNKIHPFIESMKNNGCIQIDDYIIPIDKDRHALDDFFSDAEYIITYPNNNEILCTKKMLLNYLLEKTKDAVLDIQNSFQDQFKDIQKILNKFPYTWMSKSKNQDIIFFFQEEPKYFMSKYKFVVQTTLGIPITYSIKVMKILSEVFVEAGGNPIFNIINIVEHNSKTIYQQFKTHWRTTNRDILNSWLFLLFYSAHTRFSRKSKALFVIRMTMMSIAKYEIDETDLDLLENILSLPMYENDLNCRYILNNILFNRLNLTQYDRMLNQSIVDVTMIPYDEKNKMVYMEFRGFRTVLTNHCKTRNLYLNDILVAKSF
jgi:hypothetical protein